MIKPLGDNVLLEIHKSAFSAMEAVDEEENKVEKATVLSVGDECSKVKEGDVVYFKKYNLDKIIDGKDEYNLIPESDVKGILI